MHEYKTQVYAACNSHGRVANLRDSDCGLSYRRLGAFQRSALACWRGASLRVLRDRRLLVTHERDEIQVKWELRMNRRSGFEVIMDGSKYYSFLAQRLALRLSSTTTIAQRQGLGGF